MCQEGFSKGMRGGRGVPKGACARKETEVQEIVGTAGIGHGRE